jgi:hypothetical protein
MERVSALRALACGWSMLVGGLGYDALALATLPARARDTGAHPHPQRQALGSWPRASAPVPGETQCQRDAGRKGGGGVDRTRVKRRRYLLCTRQVWCVHPADAPETGSTASSWTPSAPYAGRYQDGNPIRITAGQGAIHPGQTHVCAGCASVHVFSSANSANSASSARCRSGNQSLITRQRGNERQRGLRLFVHATLHARHGRRRRLLKPPAPR